VDKPDANALLQELGPEGLRQLLDDEAAWAPETESAPAAEPAAVRATPFVLRDPSLIPRRDWLYSAHYIRGFVSMTIAPGGVGKSSLVMAEAVAMATGRRLLHHAPRKPLRVWLWNGEDPRDELERRIAAICLHHGITQEHIGDRLFVDSGRDMEIKIATADRNGVHIAVPVIDSVIATIRENKIDLLVIDPFVSSHSVNENDNAAIDAVAKKFAYIATQAGCAIELVHHVRKGPSVGSHEISADDARGASALAAAARSVRLIQRMTDEEAKKAMITEPWRYIRAVDGKANLAPPASKSEWYRLESFELPNGFTDGHTYERGDSVGVVILWSYPANLTEDEDLDRLRAVQEKVKAGEGTYREDVRAGDWVGKHIASTLGLDFTDKKDKRTLQKLVQDMIEKGWLRVFEGRGPHRDLVKFVDVGNPV
jgi:hypothetical protein